VALSREQAIRFAAALRELRESTWPDLVLTQGQLAQALSLEGRVAPATLSSWESVTNPKTPSVARIASYARFFCTERSLEGEPHLIPEDQLTPDELKRLREIESHLLELSNPQQREVQRTFQFDAGPVTLICPTAPTPVRGSLADEHDPNFTKLQQYGDLDALIQLYGHVRAENPNLEVVYRLSSEVVPEDYSSHVILLGGVGWNEGTRRMQAALGQVPIQQIAVDDLSAGDAFRVETDQGARIFYPGYEELGGRRELVADVSYVARLRNPFKFNRTLTICNGIHSRGVLGAVRSLTDPGVSEENEKYLADRFPEGEFAILLRARVVGNQTLSPDFLDPEARLFIWEPNHGGELTEAGIAASRVAGYRQRASA